MGNLEIIIRPLSYMYMDRSGEQSDAPVTRESAWREGGRAAHGDGDAPDAGAAARAEAMWRAGHLP